MRVYHRPRAFTLLLLFAFSKARAVASIESQILPESLTPSSIIKLVKPAIQETSNEAEYHLGFQSMYYLTPLPGEASLNQSEMLMGSVKATKESPFLMAHLDAGASLGTQGDSSHIYVKEGFLASDLHEGEDWQFSLGRREFDWSEADSFWKLGLWQPTFTLDALRPDTQGLTGLFYSYNADGFRILGFVTPMFIPSMGPNIRNENGAIQSDSRFYTSPQKQYPLAGKTTQFVYNLDIPEISNLVNQPGAGFSFQTGSLNQGWALISSVGDKPVNQLVLKYNGKLALSESQIPNGKVVVSPAVGRHQIVSADVVYSASPWKTILSYLGDRPQNLNAPQDWKMQQLDPISIYSMTIKFDVNQWIGREMQFSFGYMKAYGGGVNDLDSDGTRTPSFFGNRLNFMNLARFDYDVVMTRFHNGPVSGKISYLYEFDQRGKIVNYELKWSANKKWTLLAGADFLGPDDANSDADGFINQFRANDRVYTGFDYVF